jgi:glycosyltransferase involved in cell wall biosynthesis
MVMPGYHTILEEFCGHLSKLGATVTLFLPVNFPRMERPFQIRSYKTVEEESDYPLATNLIRELDRGEFDVMVTSEEFQLISWEAGFFSVMKGIPFVVIQEKYFVSRKSILAPIHRLLLKTVSRIMWRLSSRIIAHSSAARRFIGEHGAPSDKVELVPIGVDVERFSPGNGRNSKSPYSILSVARLIEHKGLMDLIEAIDILVERGMEICLTIVGDGELRVDIEEEISNRGLTEVVDLRLRVPFENMVDVYRSKDIFVLSSVVEVFGVAALEAMASGMPVVVTRVGGLPDLVEEGFNGLVVEPRDPEGLSDAISSMLDCEKISSMGRNARRKAIEEFSWSRVAKDHLRVFEEACNRIDPGGM